MCPSAGDRSHNNFLTVTVVSLSVVRNICPPGDCPILGLSGLVIGNLACLILREVACLCPLSHQSTELFVLRSSDGINNFVLVSAYSYPVGSNVCSEEIELINVESVEHSGLLGQEGILQTFCLSISQHGLDV